MKRLEEEMKRVQQEEEERRKAAEEEAAAKEEKERKRIEGGEGSSGTKRDTDAEMEKRISEWVANLSLGEDEEAESYVTRDERDALASELAAMEDPMERREREEEQKLAWKLRMKREKKRRREEVNKLTAEVAKVLDCRKEVHAQTDDKAKWDKVLGYLEVLSTAWMEERQASWSQEVALSAMRSGFRDIVTHIGGEVKQLRDNVGKFCEGAIEGAKAIAVVEGEARPREDPVKLKFPDAYGGKEEENFDNWEASVNSYVYLQHILTEEQVLVAFQALKDEAASFARSLARAAGCENNTVAYSKITTLPQFFKLLRERFADPTRGVRASDKLQTIHSGQWRSARALEGVMDDLVAVPDHEVTETQLVQLFYRAMPEPLRGDFFEKSQQADVTYDVLSREVVLYESKSMPVSTFWLKDLDKGKRWKGRTISDQVRAKDHMILTLEGGGTDEVPYSQIEWGFEEEDSSVGQGGSYAVVAAGGRPQTNYYRKFVRNFSTIAAPLHRLLKKEAIWQWDKDCTSALKKLKCALIEYPVLKVADPSLPIVVTMDASQYGIGAVLQQDDGNGYRPIEFMSARMPSKKVATSTYERELYALRQALEHWKHYLLGRHFKVYSDHETLRWLKTQAKMTPKLTRWAAEIDQYDFELKPVKGPEFIVEAIIGRRTTQESSADALATFYYPPVAAVTVSYPISAVREDRLVDGLLKGFGQLHPRSQGIQTLGTIYSSSLFPNRAPEKRVLLLNYIGGATYPQILSQDEEEIVKRVDADLRNLILKKDAVTPRVHGVRVWPRAIPQFNVGHLDLLEDAKKGLEEVGLKGLFLGGNYVAGVALGRCVEAAYESAEEISKYMRSEVVM
ncbi:hypothetical protein CBR_g88559 [Chara braunii]|uniref:protoporphyrinogen oxidase n=1 Tax=Chara braunii TaxID=69332 RepID=A0A388KB42_CHABU|nr:hypothetical protein CBR_g88559 [Chara braunii]|eukprot:GBG67270.1 hypothetical protein CBR_g88559 [Chara braunii]